MKSVIIILCFLLIGCGEEGPEFVAAKADWEQAHRDFEEATSRGDPHGQRLAFSRELAALRKQIAVCRHCSVEMKKNVDRFLVENGH